MHIRVLLFGVLRDMIPGGSRILELPQGSTVGTVLTHYRDLAPEPATLWTALAVAVNQEYAPLNFSLSDGDEVALLPPVSGGSGSGGDATPVSSPDHGSSSLPARVALVREPIPVTAIVDSIKQGADGAVAVFDGIVRNNTRGRRTLYLVYDAYEEMALRQMEGLAREAMATKGIREAAIVHRLGKLQVGETSILIAAASAHRAQAFDACRWIIDTLKKTVPIWKKEYFEDGAVWADGEPFPPLLVGKGSDGA